MNALDEELQRQYVWVFGQVVGRIEFCLALLALLVWKGRTVSGWEE